MSSGDEKLKYASLVHEQNIGPNGGTLNFYVDVVDSEPEEMLFIPLNLETSSETYTLTYLYPLIRSRAQNLSLRGSFYARSSREKTLSSYCATYLKEEIQAEALTRNIEGFSRFLHVAAACAGSFLDLSKLASEAGVARQSAVRFFEILEDTLIVRRAEAFAKSERRRLVQHPRYFFFDTGVLNGVMGNFEPSPDRIGLLMEHLVFNQIVHTASSLDQDIWAFEVKASKSIGKHDLRGLKRFREFHGKKCGAVVLYLGTVEKQIEGIEILPWQAGLERIGL